MYIKTQTGSQLMHLNFEKWEILKNEKPEKGGERERELNPFTLWACGDSSQDRCFVREYEIQLLPNVMLDLCKLLWKHRWLDFLLLDMKKTEVQQEF